MQNQALFNDKLEAMAKRQDEIAKRGDRLLSVSLD